MPGPEGSITTIKEESSRQGSAAPPRASSSAGKAPPPKAAAQSSPKASRANLSQAGLPPKVRGSQANLGTASRSNLKASNANIRGSRNLAGSKPKLNDEGAPERITMENTYQMKPIKKFRPEQVQRMVKEMLETKLTKATYSDKSAELAKSISNEILQEVKKLGFDRYKFVAEVNIGEFKGQGIRVASRSLWDTTTDSYASASFRNASMFAVAMVFGVYYE